MGKEQTGLFFKKEFICVASMSVHYHHNNVTKEKLKKNRMHLIM